MKNFSSSCFILLRFNMMVVGILLSCTALFAQSGMITAFAGYGSGVTGAFGVGDGLIADSAVFSQPGGICVDVSGNVFIADSRHYRIRKINAAAGIVTTIAGNGINGDSCDGCPGPAAKIGYVSGICLDKYGNVYIVDGGNHKIKKIDMTTGIITTIASVEVSYSASGIYDNGIFVDINGNLFFTTYMNRIQEIDASGSYSTIAGTWGTSGFGGDGGPATAALLNSPRGITGDTLGNLYVADYGNNRIRKIDSAGIITSIAGNDSARYSSWFSYISGNYFGSVDVYYGDGGPATNAQIMYPEHIKIDRYNNLYISSGLSDYPGHIIRKIDANTHQINKIAGNDQFGYGFILPGMSIPDLYDLNLYSFALDNSGNIFYMAYYGSIISEYSVNKITHPTNILQSISVIDSLPPVSSSVPSIVYFGLKGTINCTPGPTDSAHIYVNFRDGSPLETIVLPYWSYIISAGDTVRGFGDSTYTLCHHYYSIPGKITPTVTIQTLGESNNALSPEFSIGNPCDSGITGISITGVTDSIVSPPCTGGTVRYIVTGSVSGTPSVSDSAYLVIQNSDGTYNTHSAPITLSGGAYGFVDTSYHNFSSSLNYIMFYRYANTIWGDTSFYYYPKFYVTNSSGKYFQTGNGPGFVVDSCSDNYYGYRVKVCTGSEAVGTYNYLDTLGFGGYKQWNQHIAVVTFCSLPDTVSFKFDSVFIYYGATASVDSFTRTLYFGDGISAGYSQAGVSTYGHGIYFLNEHDTTIRHAYATPGIYRVYLVTTNGAYTQVDTIAVVDAGSCELVSGVFYMDLNHSCTPDSGETRLEYWPFKVVNNTVGFTQYYWSDDTGGYHIKLSVGQDYSIYPNYIDSVGYTSGDSLTLSCPTTHVVTMIPVDTTYATQNFGFNCTAPSLIDMTVSGWEWGIIPGDTGIINIWSSDLMGYNCDTLTATIQLTYDTSLLTYCGIADGPLPDSIAGNILFWSFSTFNNLFDFNVSVKVLCSTTAVMGNMVHNKIYVSPTSLPDPDTLNNLYSWTQPVTSSWDPNEIQVSPIGIDTPGYISSGTPLSYLIHFQNTGTAPAQNIVILDTLSEYLDISTTQIISTGSPVIVTQLPGYVLQFKFHNINLPDSSVDRKNSISYIGFNIFPFDGIPQGGRILDKAGIYFDYNPVVMTNATLNTILDSLPGITGPSSLCSGDSMILNNTFDSGRWHSTNGNASISQTGMVMGIHPGYDTIEYVAGPYRATKTIYIKPLPFAGAIIGFDSVCTGSVVYESPAVSGGIWSMSNGNATNSYGTIQGIMPGLDTVFYTVANSCGTKVAIKTVTINPLPDVGNILGKDSICAGASLTLSDTTAGGNWLSKNNSIAKVSAGIVTGVATSIRPDTILYIVTNAFGCSTTRYATVFVDPLPVVGVINGLDSVCTGANIVLTDSIPGGTWSSSNSHASVLTGKVYGQSQGADTILYKTNNSYCGNVTSKTIWVKPLPDTGSIVGQDRLCSGATSTLSANIAYGEWQSIDATILTITGESGIVSAISPGTDTIIYTVVSSCGTVIINFSIVVDSPLHPKISGPANLCIGLKNDTLKAVPGGGAWYATNTNVRLNTLGQIGVISSRSSGFDTILYTVSNNCGVVSDTIGIQVMASSECDSMVPLTAMNIYPNPSNGIFTIEMPQKGNAVIIIIDLLNNVLINKTITVGAINAKVDVDLKGIAPGAYFLRVAVGNSVYRGKILIME